MCFVQDAEGRLKIEVVPKQVNRWCELRVVYLQGVATSTTGTQCPLTLYYLPSSQSPSWPRISQKGDTESVSVSAPAAVALAGSSEGSRLEPAAGRCEGGVGWCGRCEVVCEQYTHNMSVGFFLLLLRREHHSLLHRLISSY